MSLHERISFLFRHRLAGTETSDATRILLQKGQPITSYMRATAPFVWASKLATCKKKQYWNGRASRICSKSCHAKRTESREIITTQWTRKSIEAIPHSMRMIESSAHTMVQKCQSGLRRWTNGLPTIIAGMHVDCESKESRGLHDVICMALESLKGFEAH